MRIGEYEVVRVIGAGGMGVVYEACDPAGQHVALKMLNEAYACHEGVCERLLREAHAQMELGTYPYILRCHTCFEQDGHLVLVLDYMPNGTLAEVIARGGASFGQIMCWAQQVLIGLNIAHTHGYIHRDIKPSNILLDQHRRAVIGDFGIAHARGSGMTQAGRRMGQLEYMSPEQLTGHTRAETDVYGFGVTWYELLTGALPFQRFDSDEEIESVIMSRAPYVSLHTKKPEVPTRVAAIVDRCVAKDYRNRFSSPQDVLMHVQGALTSAPRMEYASYVERNSTIERLRKCIGHGCSTHRQHSWKDDSARGEHRLSVHIDGIFQADYRVAQREFWIGRDPVVNDVVIALDTVSRRHACLRPECGGTWMLLDNYSANGTYLNGSKVVGAVKLPAGSDIRLCQIADIVLVFE
jgi:serine/threonine protein kinase